VSKSQILPWIQEQYIPSVRRYNMWMVAGFFDESTDESTEGICYTVAGFIGNQLITATLELRWRCILDRYGLDYFKASELSAGTGQFQKFRDDPNNFDWRPFSQREKEIFTKIKTEFTEVILSCSSDLYGIGAVVILPDLERVRKDFDHAKSLPMPYFLCANMVLVEAGLEMLNQNKGVTPSELCYLRPIFDSHEDYSGRVKSTWDTFCQKNPNASRYIDPPHYEKEEVYLTLQAADNLAFEIRKFLGTLRRKLPIRESMRGLLQNYMTIYNFNYDTLKMVADAQIGIFPEKIRDAVKPIKEPLEILRTKIET